MESQCPWRDRLRAASWSRSISFSVRFAAITKLMLAKPSRSSGAEAAEAPGEAYTMALDDVLSFAVIAQFGALVSPRLRESRTWKAI